MSAAGAQIYDRRTESFVPRFRSMTDDNVLPFKQRPRVLSEQELDAFRLATRNWHPKMREMMFPEHVKQDRDREQD